MAKAKQLAKLPYLYFHLFLIVCSMVISAPVIARNQHGSGGLYLASSDSPLNCRLDHKIQIFCDVVDDTVTLSGITLNRGNCPSPFPTEHERTEVKKFMDGLSDKDSMGVMFGLPIMVMLNSMGECSSNTKSETERRICAMAPELQKVIANPQNTYKFGDHFIIPLSLCDNLLEWSISTDKGDWTWSNSK